MRRIALVLVLAACGGRQGPATPAADGVRAYLAALRSDDARAAYGLLAHDARKNVSFDQFALEWKQTRAERAWQAKALEESLRGNPDVGERALISFSDGKLVQLEREGKTWRLEVTAISLHAYPHVQDKYVLLPHGASMGSGYGPIVVAREQATESSDVTGRRVKIHVQEGDPVRQGQLLAELDPRIPEAQASYASANIETARKAAATTKPRKK